MKTATRHLVLDEHVATVVEFMERSLPADRLEYVATRLPAIARILWAVDRCALLEHSPIRASQLAASEPPLAGTCVGDDSAAVSGGPA
jgi:hypothetical protein